MTEAIADLNRGTFRDRDDAGRALAVAVRQALGAGGWSAPADVVVLGLPRGGVPVARHVADALEAPLDVLVVRKLGAPLNPEFAIGAIGEGGVRVVDDATVRLLGVTAERIEELVAAELAELDRRVAAYRGDRPPVPTAGRTVVIVDDGVATGATALAAVRAVRSHAAARVVLATPVAPAAWRAGALAREADLLVAVREPADLGAVGAFYRDFTATSDDAVRSALTR